VKPATHTEDWLDLKDPLNQVDHIEEWDNFGSTGDQNFTTGEIACPANFGPTLEPPRLLSSPAFSFSGIVANQSAQLTKQ
jgi:hypothetical protein